MLWAQSSSQRKFGVSVERACIELGLQNRTLCYFFLTFKYGFENDKISNHDGDVHFNFIMAKSKLERKGHYLAFISLIYLFYPFLPLTKARLADIYSISSLIREEHFFFKVFEKLRDSELRLLAPSRSCKEAREY